MIAAKKKKPNNGMELDSGESLKDMQEKYTGLQKKYKQICYDVRDAERENYCAKEELLETIRTCDREMDFLKQIALVLFSEQEIDQIKDSSKYNEEKDDYLLPKFFFQELDNVQNLPKLGNDKSAQGGNNNFVHDNNSKGFSKKRTMKFNDFGEYGNKNRYTSMAEELFEQDNLESTGDYNNYPGISSNQIKSKKAAGVHLKSIESRDDLMQQSWPRNSEQLNFQNELQKTTKLGGKAARLAPINDNNIFGNPESPVNIYESRSPINANNNVPMKKAKLQPLGMPPLY